MQYQKISPIVLYFMSFITNMQETSLADNIFRLQTFSWRIYKKIRKSHFESSLKISRETRFTMLHKAKQTHTFRKFEDFIDNPAWNESGKNFC